MAIIELVDRGTGESGQETIEGSKAGRSRGLFGRRRRRQAEDVVERAGEAGAGLATAVTEAVEDATEAISETAEEAVEKVTDAAEDVLEDDDSSDDSEE